MDVSLILTIVAFILFVLAAFGVNAPVGLGWAGLALLTLALILDGATLGG